MQVKEPYVRTTEHRERLSEAAKKRGTAHMNTPEAHEKVAAKRRGLKFSDEWRKNLSESHKGNIPTFIPHLSGDENANWKGDDVGYRALHHWVVRKLGKPEYCRSCNKQGTGHAMHWANISHNYKRLITDWIRLCPSCHGKYDRNELELPLH